MDGVAAGFAGQDVGMSKTGAVLTGNAARVVLLSDGLANTGGSGDTLLAEARAAMHAGVRFDTVGLGIDQDSQLMTALAAESGGMTIKR